MIDRRQPLTLPIALTLLVAFGSSCASMQQRVTESENRSNTLQAQVADLQATQQNIIGTMTMLRRDLETALDPVRAQQASGGADLRSLQAQIASMEEQVRILTEQLAAYETTGITVGATPAPTTPPTGAAAGGNAPARSATSDQDVLFNAAYGDYTAGQFVLAVSGFEEFVSRHPDSPRAPDAVYWIGEMLAEQELHGEARRRFLEVPRAYPGSPKVADAILRAALEAVELGQLDDAIRELRELVAAHANTDAALIGCMQLDRLGQTLPAGCQFP